MSNRPIVTASHAIIGAMSITLGLIAGQGRLPILEARGMRAAGFRVACVGIAGQTDPTLREECDAYAEAGLVQIGRWMRLLRRWKARHAVMVGGVRKARMYEPMRLLRQVPDWRAAKLWYRVLRHDRRDQTLLEALANELARGGIELMDTTRYIADHLATAGVMTKREPTDRQWADIRFAWPILMRLNELDVGQAVAVKERNVVAVEAIEGTDAMIDRAGALCRSGDWILAKGAGAAKDRRFDVPTVGEATIERLKANGCRCLAVTAGQVILVEKPRLLEAADAAGIAVVGVDADEASAQNATDPLG
jgi:DUF1009 family protein